MSPSVRGPDESKALRAFAVEVARLLADRHCEDIRLVDVQGLSQVTDYVLIASGTSDRQMKAVAQELAELGKSEGRAAFRSDTDRSVTWVVVDFVELVVHLFEPGRRAFYDLEGLWSDAVPVPWEREEKPQSQRAQKSESQASS